MNGRTLRALCVGTAVGAATLSLVRPTFADADGAKKYLQQAKTDAENQDLKSADTNLQLAEAELDGVDAAAKDSIARDIAALRKTITDAQNAGQKDAIQKDLDSRMDNAKRDLDGGYFDDEKDILDFLSKDEVKAALGADAVAKYRKQLTTFHKVAAAKAAVRNMEQLKSDIERIESEWADKQKDVTEGSPEARASAVESMQRDLEQAKALTKDMPADNAQGQALVARYKKIDDAVTAAYLKGKVDETLDRIKRSLESYQDEWAGWDKETAGPTFDEMLHRQSDAMSHFNAPKSAALVTRVNYLMEQWLADDTVRQLSNTDPKVKAALDDVRKQRQAAWDKIAKFASSILDEAGKAMLDKDARDRLETLANDDLRLSIEGSDQLKPLQQRALKLVSAFDQKALGGAAAQEKLYATLTEQANKAWPAMIKQFDGAGDGIDAVAASQNIDASKGKTIRLKSVNNRMGWDYSPSGGSEFAITIDAVAVAGKYGPTIRKAFNTITARTGKDFSDMEYDVVATIDGLGPVVKIARAEGDLKTNDGERVGTITAQRNETVSGIKLTILAIHVGPLAATESGGAVDENGNVGQ